MKNNQLIFDFYWFFAALSSAGFLYEYFTLFKLILIIISAYILYENFSEVKNLFLNGGYRALSYFAIYGVSILFSIRVIDDWSLRVVFNVIVIIFAALAGRVSPLGGRHFWYIFFVAVLSAIYRHDRFLGGDGKPLIHDQALMLVTLLAYFYAINHLGIKYFWYFVGFLVPIFSQVRTLFFAIIYAATIVRFGFLFLFFTISGVIYFCFSYYEDLIYLDGFGSLTWRIYHWNQMLSGFDPADYFFGTGIGSIWRDSLNLDTFYSDNISYIDSHSYYVQIFYDAGIFGVLSFVILMFYLYRGCNFDNRFMLLLFVAYGVFQGGVWQYSLTWLFILSKGDVKYEENFQKIALTHSIRHKGTSRNRP